MNLVVIKGRIARMDDLRYTQSGTAVVSFSVAVDRRFSKEKEADFINVTAWQKTAEFIAQYFAKGQEILINGRLQVSSYDKDGEKRYKTEVIAENVEFCGSKKQENASPFGLGEEVVFDDNLDLPW
jgi:single-strand DNA-binding protein